MNLFTKFLERNNVFEKLRNGSDESTINVCNSIASFISKGSLRGSQPTLHVDEILMIFLEYMSLSASCHGMRSVLLCIESISKINKKHEDCVLQTGLVGSIVDLLQKIQRNKLQQPAHNDNIGVEIGFIITRILSYFTGSDKRSCLIFRLHHGVHSLTTFIEHNKKHLLQTKQYNQIIAYTLNICHHCVTHSEHVAMQMFEANGLEMCLEFLSNLDMIYMNDASSDTLRIKQCVDLIYFMCRLNAKVNSTFIKANGFKIIIDYLCSIQTNKTPETKANILKLLQLLSTLCTDRIGAKTLLSTDALSKLYPFLLAHSQQNDAIKCVSAQLLNNILRFGMKDTIESQSSELYKFHETYTRIQMKKNNATITDEKESISFPELEPLRKRKAERQQMIHQLECVPKSVVSFVTQPPLYSWCQISPSELTKIKQEIQSKNKKRKKRHSVPSISTFNKPTFAGTRRRKSTSFTTDTKDLSNTRSSSLVVKTVSTKTSIKNDGAQKQISSNEEIHTYATTKWIKNYYTNTTFSYLQKLSSKKGDALSAQPSNLIIKLLYEQIMTKSASNVTFTPKIIYDRNELLLNNTSFNVSSHKKQSNSLEFESRFECGNLHRVIQTAPFEYDLLLSTDYNCNRHRQWFYFRVKNMKQDVEYKFNIVNYDKNDSVFNQGCKPTIYSAKRFKETGVGWHRANASDIAYYSNSFKNNYQAKYKELDAVANNINSIHVQMNQSEENREDDIANLTPQKKNIKCKKAVSLTNSEKCHKQSNGRLHNDCHSEPKVASISSSTSSSLLSTPNPSSREQTPTEPMTRLNYKQIRKRKARLRNKKLCETEKEKQSDIESMASCYTNVLHRHNSLSFDILLPTKKIIGTRKKSSKKATNQNNITHNIPSVPSILMRKKEETTESNKKYHYTLSFTIKFPHSNDTCFVSYFYPFSYSDLQGMLNILSISPITNSFNIFRRQLLCRSRLGNRVDLLTVTNFNSTINVIRDRSVIILSARVHPGEVNASWIMKGIIDFLLSKNPIACELRNRFVFKIIPCLNPDGVICGNYRCSLSGVDLNRQYLNTSHINHPSIFHLKKLVSAIYNDMTRNIFLICDLHGHSRMMNAALYGCAPDSDSKANKNSNYKTHNQYKAKLASMDYLLPSNATETTERYKLFPYLLSQRAPNMFSYDQCIWNISKQKESTARVVFWRQFNIQNTFTLESTFCGSNLNYNLKGFHFDTQQYLEIGAKFCAALYDIGSQTNEAKNKVQNAIKHLKSTQLNNSDQNYSNKKIKTRKKKR